LPEDLMFKHYENSNLDYGFVFDGPVPIIPFGESANGIRVVNIRLEEAPILDIEGGYATLDFRLRESKSSIEDYQYLYIELEVQGIPNRMVVYHEVDDGIFDTGTGREAIFYSNDGPFTAIDYYWKTQFRYGKNQQCIFGSLPYEFDQNRLILLITEREGGGPAYALQ
jgi:hypothetical protein